MNKARVSIAGLSLSAAAFVGILTHEGYRDRAYIPVPGDVPTIGFGTTEGVKMGQSIDPVNAVIRAQRDVTKFESGLKQCVTAPLYQYEYDTYTSMVYNMGTARFCASSIPTKLNAGQYEAACKTILEFTCGPATQATRAKKGEKCYHKTRPLRQLPGLLSRRQKEYEQCIGKQQ